MNNNLRKGDLLNKTQKIIIICLMSLVIVLLSSYIAYAKLSFSDTRTVMMYINGSDLESDASIVTADLNAIDPNKVDLNNTNVLIYTGGTKKWHNFVSNQENAIYELTKNGFKKVKVYPKENMGDSNTLSEFLKYSYSNYKTDKYDLIIYNHGIALSGAIFDDFTKDSLDLSEFNTALKKSPFNKNNKIETTIFRTCLNGTIEMASVFSDYSKYLVASEEITWGSPYTSVLSFLNNVKSTDDGVQFGKKFMDRYKMQISEIDPLETKVMTYAIIDLSKLNKVINNLNDYASSINLNNSYIDISTIRSNLYQFGVEEPIFDMVDLYELASKTSDYSKNSQELIKSIDDAVLYNISNSKESHGLSIYFPYRGPEDAKNMYLTLYSRMNKFKEYSKFINEFNSRKEHSGKYAFSFSKNESTVKNKKEVSFSLSADQKRNYAGALYTIFKRDKKDRDYYEMIYSSDEVSYKDGVITTNIGNNLIKVKDKNDSDDSFVYVPSYKRVNGDTTRHILLGILYDTDKSVLDVDNFMTRAKISISFKNNKPVFSTVTRQSTDEKLDGILLNIKDFETLNFNNTRVKFIRDKNNNITDNWKIHDEIKLTEIKTKNIELKVSNLDDGGEYYCLFNIFDNNDNSYYSDLIKIR